METGFQSSTAAVTRVVMVLHTVCSSLPSTTLPRSSTSGSEENDVGVIDSLRDGRACQRAHGQRIRDEDLPGRVLSRATYVSWRSTLSGSLTWIGDGERFRCLLGGRHRAGINGIHLDTEVALSSDFVNRNRTTQAITISGHVRGIEADIFQDAILPCQRACRAIRMRWCRGRRRCTKCASRCTRVSCDVTYRWRQNS